MDLLEGHEEKVYFPTEMSCSTEAISIEYKKKYCGILEERAAKKTEPRSLEGMRRRFQKYDVSSTYDNKDDGKHKSMKVVIDMKN